MEEIPQCIAGQKLADNQQIQNGVDDYLFKKIIFLPEDLLHCRTRVVTKRCDRKYSRNLVLTT
jgi:hypothetical protein